MKFYRRREQIVHTRTEPVLFYLVLTISAADDEPTVFPAISVGRSMDPMCRSPRIITHAHTHARPDKTATKNSAGIWSADTAAAVGFRFPKATGDPDPGPPCDAALRYAHQSRPVRAPEWKEEGRPDRSITHSLFLLLF